MKALITYLFLGALIQIYRLLPDEKIKFIDSKIPHFKTATICISIVLVVIGVGLQIKSEFVKKKYSLFLVPESRVISPGTKEQFILKIVNNENFPFYQIDLNTSVEYGDLTVNEIIFKAIDTPKMEFELGGIKGSWDMFGIVECGFKSEHHFIYDIDAHSTKEFEVIVNAKDKTEHAKITFSIVRTALEPTKTIEFDPFNKCKNDKADFDTYYKTGKSMIDDRRYHEAIFCLEKSIKLKPNSSCAHLNLGNAFHFVGQDDKAIEEWGKVINQDPKNPKPLLNTAIVLIERKQC